MSELKDPAIKLFGKTIPLLETTPPPVSSVTGGPAPPLDPPSDDLPASQPPPGDEKPSAVGDDEEPDKESSNTGPSDTKQEDGSQPMTSEEIVELTNGVANEKCKTPSGNSDAGTSKASKAEEEQCETSNSQEKTLKKPDKILPCPRCNSMETKFCYYNNYNVNQPRHFCKNCQRYWTAGGTMRNVPVGAGRRKNKNLISQCRNISVPEALQHTRADLPNGVHHPALKTSGTVLTFGSDSPLCESMASGLNIAEKGVRDCVQSGFQKPEELRIPVSYGVGENGIDHSRGSSVTALNSKDIGNSGLQSPVMQNSVSFPPQVPCFPGAPWPYPWNAAQWTSPGPPPAFCPPGFPMPFYPAPPFWACPIPGVLNVPWVTPLPTSQNLTALSSPTSPTLGKHSRDETMLPSKCGNEEPQQDKSPERCLWVPKTLRVDDPEEAAKSSIWATLGIKNDKSDLIRGGGIFRAFQPETKEKDHQSETSSVLKANPAALSRSLNFHESS